MYNKLVIQTVFARFILINSTFRKESVYMYNEKDNINEYENSNGNPIENDDNTQSSDVLSEVKNDTLKEEIIHEQSNFAEVSGEIENEFSESDNTNTADLSTVSDASQNHNDTLAQSNTTSGYEWSSAPPQNSGKKPKKKHSGLSIFTAIMLSVFAISFTATASILAYQLFTSSDKANFDKSGASGKQNFFYDYKNVTTDPNDFAALESGNMGSALTIPQIAQKCSPGAVGIVTEVETSYNFGFFSQSGTATSMGSGFVLKSDGYIITNHHVIENAKKITVILSDKSEYEAKLIGSDSISDIAVIKIDVPDNVTLTPIEIGNSDELVVGETVVAIGCPAGIEFMGTVTDGIVSAINRDVEITDSYGRMQKTMTLIQTNATINKGNSGGPLINSRGQVVGINTLKLQSEYEGIGFSIPINGAMPIINQLIEHGKVIERTEEDFAYGSGMIGISGSPISQDEADYYGIPLGVLIVQIDKNSSAAKAGLRRGDIITAYNGTAVMSVDDINALKAKNRAGEVVTVTIYRDSSTNLNTGETLDISFKLDEQK